MFEAGEWPRYAMGAPAGVRSQLEQITTQLEVDELMVVTIVHDHQARLYSYELLAQAFNIKPDAGDASGNSD